MGNQLSKYLDKKVSELLVLEDRELSEPEKIRHQVFSNLLRAITVYYWNGNKYGTPYNYPLNPEPNDQYLDWSPFLLESYRGHNIAAIAVDASGRVIDFEFNHNEIFNSSIDHAESRLLRRVFSLRQINEEWDIENPPDDKSYGTLLGGVTVYTSLESCSQCSGIMTLAGVKDVVYLQEDTGMYQIGKILRNLSKNDDGASYLQAPHPISGSEIGLSGYCDINKAFIEFEKQQRSKTGKPFRADDEGNKRYTGSITSFLCTQSAYNYFARGWPELKELLSEFEKDPGSELATYRPGVDEEKRKCRPNERVMTNHEALNHAISFYRYVREKGDRGTPHRV